MASNGVEMKAVVSSNVLGVGYDTNKGTLHVEFIHGARYTYHDVPQQVYNDLLEAGSPGGYLNDNVKGVYRYTKG